MVCRRFSIVLTIASLTGACGKGEEAPTHEAARPPMAEIVAPAALDLRSLELDTRPAEGAGPGMWVRCAGGSLRDATNTRKACAEAAQTFVDDRDQVAIVAEASGAAYLEVAGKEARFIEARARVALDLRPLMARLPAAQVAKITTLWVPVRVVAQAADATLVGDIALETPRVMMLLEGLEGVGLRFVDEPAVAAPPKVLIVGESTIADDVPLGAIDIVALERRSPVTITCDDKPSDVMATELIVLDRRTGKRFGSKRWTPTCDDHAAHVVARDDVDAVLLADSPTIDPRLGERGVTVMPPTDVAAIKSAARFLGLDHTTKKAQLIKVLGPPSATTASAGDLETLTFGADLGAMIDSKSGVLLEVWVVAGGRDTLRSKQLDHPLLAHIGRSLKDVVAALGRPSKVGDGFVSWAVLDGAVTTYIELQCAPPDWICNELDVGWLTSAQ